ncbi:MAG: nucleotidyltransferase domain-containing protein [Thermomicrobiales bacterium]|nr:nucleotidyltransferase domain-containing protein [Thermomicrobiales bacterium]
MALTVYDLPLDRIAEICKRHHVAELSLFGSALRDDFRPDSDIDVLVTFKPNEAIGYFELADMQEELAEVFGRHVDIVLRRGIERSQNSIRKTAILSSATPVYVAR